MPLIILYNITALKCGRERERANVPIPLHLKLFDVSLATTSPPPL